jgi:hypothetical protein
MPPNRIKLRMHDVSAQASYPPGTTLPSLPRRAERGSRRGRDGCQRKVSSDDGRRGFYAAMVCPPGGRGSGEVRSSAHMRQGRDHLLNPRHPPWQSDSPFGFSHGTGAPTSGVARQAGNAGHTQAKPGRSMSRTRPARGRSCMGYPRKGCGGGNRTPNLPVNSRTLYQFNYPTTLPLR